MSNIVRSRVAATIGIRGFMKIFRVILISIFSSSFVFACEVPPKEQNTPDEELIQRTKNIVLAQVVSAQLQTNSSVVYQFKIAEIIKGTSAKTFELVGGPLWPGTMEHFEHHSIAGARLDNEPDCEIHPSFAVGHTYLMFLDKPYHRKSFEFIMRADGSPLTQDKWLQYVKKTAIN
jgi:hypothetical protein